MVAAAVALAQRQWRQQHGWRPAWQCGNGGGGMPRAVMGIARLRRWCSFGRSGNSAAALVVAITRPAWQGGGSVASLVAAPRWEARQQHGGGGGTNNQQSTKRATATATEMAIMKAMMMTMETKTMVVTCRCLPCCRILVDCCLCQRHRCCRQCLQRHCGGTMSASVTLWTRCLPPLPPPPPRCPPPTGQHRRLTNASAALTPPMH